MSEGLVCELHPKQLEFVTAAEPNALFSGGFGAGKTHALLVRECRLGSRYPHLPHGILGPTYTALRKDMIGPMRALLRSWGVRFTENRQDHHLRPEWCTEQDAGFWFAGADNPDSLKGPNWASVGINEPGIIARESYDVALSRARVPLFDCASCGEPVLKLAHELGILQAKSGEVYRSAFPCETCGSLEVENVPNPVSLAGTPEGFNWLYDEWIDQDPESHPNRDWSQYRVIYAHSRENPWVSHSSIDRLEDSYDERLAQEKVGGKFINVHQGAIYYAFDRQLHLRDDLEYDPGAPLLWGLDFNVAPLCSVVAQQRDGDLLVLDEIVSPSDGRTAELAGEMARRYPGHRGGFHVYGDRSGHNRDTRGGTRTDYRILEEAAKAHGLQGLDIRVHPGSQNPSRLDRYSLVNRLLRSAKGVTRLLVARKARRLVKDLEQQGYKKGTLIADAGKGGELGHCADALGYIAAGCYPLHGRSGPAHLPFGG